MSAVMRALYGVDKEPFDPVFWPTPEPIVVRVCPCCKRWTMPQRREHEDNLAYTIRVKRSFARHWYGEHEYRNWSA